MEIQTVHGEIFVINKMNINYVEIQKDCIMFYMVKNEQYSDAVFETKLMPDLVRDQLEGFSVDTRTV